MNDELILSLLSDSRLRVDTKAGLVYAPRSNTPSKAIGARTGKGYLRACINVDGRQRHFMVHRIVWVSVHGPVPDGWQVDHVNRRKADNRIVNLEAVPGAVNMRRAKLAGAFAHVGRKDGIRDEKGRFAKKRAGRLLDGREWHEFPDAVRAVGSARAYAVAAEQVAWWMTQDMSPEDMYEALKGVWSGYATLDLVINMVARRWIDMRSEQRIAA